MSPRWLRFCKNFSRMWTTATDISLQKNLSGWRPNLMLQSVNQRRKRLSIDTTAMEMEEWTLTSSSFTSKPSFNIQNYKKHFSARNKHFKLDGPVILITIRNGHVLNLKKGYFRSNVDTVPTYTLKLILATVLKHSKKSF